MTVVSVVLPTFNRSGVLPRAVESVLTQTFRDWELIVVDDHSTDSTADVIEQYRDPRIVRVSNAGRKGAAGARNTGICMARGEYVAFLDSDDEWLPSKLERQVEVAAKMDDGCAGVYTGAWSIKKGRSCRYRIPARAAGHVLRDYLLSEFAMPTPTQMWRIRCLLEVGGYDEQLARYEDVDLTAKLLQRYAIAALDEPLAIIHVNTRKAVAAADAMGVEALLERYAHLIGTPGALDVRRFHSDHLFLVGLAHLREGSFTMAAKYCGRALAWTPLLSPRRYLYLVFCFVVALARPSSAAAED